MYFVIGADVVPTKSNLELFSYGDASALVGEELLDILNSSSYRIFNLEVPLTNDFQPIKKQGPNLIAPTDTVEGYKSLSADLLTLANNHIMDQGENGLFSTIETLDKAKINHVGAGKNLQEAYQSFIFDFAGRKIGIYACAEHEFSIAEADKPGANPFDPLWSLDHVEELKEIVDYVIVLYHGGKEHYRYPSPNLQKTCRRLVDKGANLVVCQHSHCIGCEEKYKQSTIVYGQGNFIFDGSNIECWQTSLLLKVEDDLTISFLPLVKAENGVRLADDETGKIILEQFYLRSEKILDQKFVEREYDRFAVSSRETYLRAFSGKTSIAQRMLNKLTKGRYHSYLYQREYGEREKNRIINYVECEAHRELLIRGLKVKD